MDIDKELLKKYNVHGPRYTSYPPATQFHSDFSKKDYFWHIENSNEDPLPKPLSLYIHLPFCDTLCYYCGCYKFISPKTSTLINYLATIKDEIKMQAQLFSKDRHVQQIHLGGGTPTYLSIEQIRVLIETINDHFVLSDNDDFELAIEIDPRTTSNADIVSLASIGFNRMSFGIQDFDESVQKSINRIQAQADILERLHSAKNAGIKSISVDLIYGLPKQNVESFKQTINTIIGIRPDRIALYNYAHMPKFVKSQRLINAKDLPDTNSKMELMTMSIHKLLDAGYIHIGMDHFALPNDSLSVSLSARKLHRNFQGYSTHGDCDLIGFGVSAISHIGDCYSQNTKILSHYKDVIAAGEPTFFRGYNLSRDDVIRIDVIQQLMCRRTLDLENFSLIHAINAQHYFNRELDALKIMTAEGLLTIENKIITITDDGCLFLRNIAMIFDKYLQLDLNNNGQDKLTQPLNTSSLTNLHSSKNISFSKVL